MKCYDDSNLDIICFLGFRKLIVLLKDFIDTSEAILAKCSHVVLNLGYFEVITHVKQRYEYHFKPKHYSNYLFLF